MGEFREVPYSGERLPATLALADGIAQEWSVKALTVKLAREVCSRYGTRTREDESRAIREWINGRVTYYLDPHGAEMVSDPLFTLQHGGDCDDQSTLCAALLRALGHDAAVAAVQWQGRTAPSHCVCYDRTTRMVLDPISVGPENWPPAPYRVARVLTRKPTGELQDLSGLFAKLHKKISKGFQKVFPKKTLLGKIVDPFGLTGRNVDLGGRIADVFGTAALVVTGGYALGAATGATGGFWSTAAAGGSKALAAAKFAGTKALAVGKTAGLGMATAMKSMAPAMVQGLMAKQAAGTLTPADQEYLDQINAGVIPDGYAVDPGTSSYAGGSGGGGSAGDLYPEDGTDAPAQPQAAGIPWGLLALAGGVGLLALSSTKKKGRK